MIPRVTLSPEFYLTYPARLGCYHVKDETGKTIGVISKEEMERVQKFVKEYIESD